MAIYGMLYPGPKAQQPNLVLVAGKVAIGSTGAVGTQSGKGFSVTRTGAGLYTITFTSAINSVPDILYADVNIVSVSGGATQTARILTLNAAARKITLQCNADAAVNVAADPPSGSILQFVAVVQNTSSTQ
jgi:hypothetical protein